MDRAGEKHRINYAARLIPQRRHQHRYISPLQNASELRRRTLSKLLSASNERVEF